MTGKSNIKVACFNSFISISKRLQNLIIDFDIGSIYGYKLETLYRSKNCMPKKNQKHEEKSI